MSHAPSNPVMRAQAGIPAKFWEDAAATFRQQPLCEHRLDPSLRWGDGVAALELCSFYFGASTAR
jgi:hypothetical protein